MKGLLVKLAGLADQLDKIGAVKIANEVDELLQAIAPMAAEEEKYSGVCSLCKGSGAGVDSPWCEMCKGSGKGPEAEEVIELLPEEVEIIASLNKLAVIRHEKDKWNVYSKKGKRLGSYATKAEAEKRLRQIEYFKHNK